MVDALTPFATVKEISWEPKFFGSPSGNPIPKGFYRFIETCCKCLSLFKEVRDFDADLVFAQFAFHFGLVGAIASNLSMRPCVIQATGGDLKVDPLNRNRRVIVSAALRIATGVICVSKDMEGVAKELGSKSTIVIPFPVDLSDFSEGSEPKRKNQIVTVMKLNPLKGLSYLIKAMTEVKEGKLLIIGAGSEKEKSESLVHELGLENRVFLIGWVDHKGVWSYLKQSTVFVLPSLSEGTPRAILEAMMCGLPVVATKVGGIPEMIEDGVNGLLVSPKNEKALAKALTHVLSDSDFQRRTSLKNRMAVKNFKIDVIGSRVYDYLEKLVNA
jgi:glycosyltransferase involved in cell wall biosynthesis